MLEVGFLYRLRNNAVEGAGVDYRITRGYLGSVVFLFDPLSISIPSIPKAIVEEWEKVK